MKKKIDTITGQKENVYGKCDIMYSYEIEGDVHMKKILIVDDEQDIVESLKFVLEVSGFVCYTAFNGEDGLRLAKRNHTRFDYT